MAALSDFFPLVALDIPGVPAPVMEVAVRRAAIAFCEDTLLFTETLPSITAQAGVDSYTLPALPNLVHHTVLAVWYGDRLLRPVSKTDVLRVPRAPQFVQNYWFEPPDSLRLFGPAVDDSPMKVVTAVKPSPTAVVVDDSLLTTWSEAVVAYTKYWLTKQAGVPWSSADVAAMNNAIYQREVARARRLDLSGWANKTLVVAATPFA